MDFNEMMGVIIASCLGTGIMAVVGVVIFLKGELIRLGVSYEHQTQLAEGNKEEIKLLRKEVTAVEKRTTLLEINRTCLTDAN